MLSIILVQAWLGDHPGISFSNSLHSGVLLSLSGDCGYLRAPISDFSGKKDDVCVCVCVCVWIIALTITIASPRGKAAMKGTLCRSLAPSFNSPPQTGLLFFFFWGGVVFIAAQFTIAKCWKQPKHPSVNEWIKNYGTFTWCNIMQHACFLVSRSLKVSPLGFGGFVCLFCILAGLMTIPYGRIGFLKAHSSISEAC